MDPYVDVCRRFEDEDVQYVIVGVFGINFYSRKVGEVITTGDCDILLPAKSRILRKALQTLVDIGFSLEAGGEPMPVLDSVLLKGILRARAMVHAERSDARIDLCTQIAGARFDELWKTRREFIVEGVTVHAGSLQALVESKQAADRPKDRYFLEVHKEMIERLLREE